VQLEIRADDDDRTTGIVDAFAEEILTEATLLTFKNIA